MQDVVNNLFIYYDWGDDKMVDPNVINEIAKKIFRLRQDRTLTPFGEADNKSRWYPSMIERASCCRKIRSPSARWPHSLLIHARTFKHIQTLLTEKPQVLLIMNERINLQEYDIDITPIVNEYGWYLDLLKEIKSKAEALMVMVIPLNSELYWRMRYMEPLTKHKTVLNHIRLEFGEGLYRKMGVLVVGRFLYLQDNRGKSERILEVVPLLKQYGDEIIKHIDPLLVEPFSKLVSLTREFKDYPAFPIWSEDRYVCFRSHYQFEILDHYEKLEAHMYEDIGWLPREKLERISKAFDELMRKVQPIYEHNKKIFDEIDKLLLPFKISTDIEDED